MARNMHSVVGRGCAGARPGAPRANPQGDRVTERIKLMKRQTRETPTPEGRSPVTSEETVTIPPRRRGGQELPDQVQDRPEQNAGYDAAVHGEGGSGDELLQPEEAGADIEFVPPAPANARAAEIDDRAERDAAAEVRRRERRR